MKRILTAFGVLAHGHAELYMAQWIQLRPQQVLSLEISFFIDKLIRNMVFYMVRPLIALYFKLHRPRKIVCSTNSRQYFCSSVLISQYIFSFPSRFCFVIYSVQMQPKALLEVTRI